MATREPVLQSRSFGVCALGGLAIGALTSYGQTALPPELGSLANSAASWSLAAFALTLVNRVPRRGAVLGCIALAMMLVGYQATTLLRGFPVAISSVVFWGVAALVVGPILGVGAAWVRGPHPRRVAAGIAPIAGILVGEGAYGLTLLAGSTPAPYWLLEVVVGLGLVAVVAGRLRAVSAIALCVGLTTIVAGLFYLVYSGDLLSVFSSSLT